MHKITFTLKQHTPIIHFQHNQDGATLRATELKPKLDKFIWERMENGNKINREWYISNKSNALNYKVKILQMSISKVTEIPEHFPCFFATMGPEWESNPKKFVFNPNPIQIQISSFENSLISKVQELFDEFILNTNFGMRQSKGFGCFFCENQSNLINQKYFEINDSQSNDFKSVFKSIDLFYRSLRGGVRTYGAGGRVLFYFKSLLVDYYHNKSNVSSLKWDKAAIKETRNTNNSQNNGIDIKDLLGLSTNEKWGNTMSVEKEDYRKTKTKEIEDKLKNRGIPLTNEIKTKLIVELIDLKEKTIERFASPITFKPMHIKNQNKWHIYIKYNPIPAHLLESTIVAKANGKYTKLKVWEDFDFEDFIHFISSLKDEENLNDYIQKYDKKGLYEQFINSTDYRNLKGIYSKLSV